ncbi:MAG: hypothetical protein HFE81_00950 [Bacilli bacterium]|nr:hypothetical protein [Bacilli bacterium]
MKKILVTIYVLSIGKEFDIFVPIDIPLMNAINLIQKSIFEMSEGNYVIKQDNQIMLFNEAGNIINSNNVVKYSGLKNGSKVLMI